MKIRKRRSLMYVRYLVRKEVEKTNSKKRIKRTLSRKLVNKLKRMISDAIDSYAEEKISSIVPFQIFHTGTDPLTQKEHYRAEILNHFYESEIE